MAESLIPLVLYDFYFDYNENLFYFSREEEKRRVFVKNKEASLYYDGIVALKNTPDADSPHYLVVPFDARYIGLLYGTRFNSPDKVKKVEAFKQYFKSPTINIADVRKINEGVIQIDSFNVSSQYPLVVEWTQLVDSSKGFGLVKMQVHEFFLRKGQNPGQSHRAYLFHTRGLVPNTTVSGFPSREWKCITMAGTFTRPSR